MIKLALFATVAVAYYIPQLGEARDISKDMLRREAEVDDDEVHEVLNEKEMAVDTTVPRDEDGDEDGDEDRDEDEISLKETKKETKMFGKINGIKNFINFRRKKVEGKSDEGKSGGEPIRALVIVDVQASFLEFNEDSKMKGSLPVPNSADLPERIMKLLEWDKTHNFFDFYILTQDWHSINHIANADVHEDLTAFNLGGTVKAKVYCRMEDGKAFKDEDLTNGDNLKNCCSQTWKNTPECKPCGGQDRDTDKSCKEIDFPVWTDHCLKDGNDRRDSREKKKDLSPDIPDSLKKLALERRAMTIEIKKGIKPDRESFSMFADAGTNMLNGTNDILRKKGITNLYFTGLATDYCVGRSALHALGKPGKAALEDKKHDYSKHTILIDPYRVIMFTDLMEGIFLKDTKEMVEAIKIADGKFMHSSDIMDQSGAWWKDLEAVQKLMYDLSGNRMEDGNAYIEHILNDFERRQLKQQNLETILRVVLKKNMVGGEQLRERLLRGAKPAAAVDEKKMAPPPVDMQQLDEEQRLLALVVAPLAMVSDADVLAVLAGLGRRLEKKQIEQLVGTAL